MDQGVEFSKHKRQSSQLVPDGHGKYSPRQDKSVKQIIFDLNRELLLEDLYARRMQQTDEIM